MSRLEPHGPATIGHMRFMGHIVMNTTLTDRMFSHLQKHKKHSLNLVILIIRPDRKQEKRVNKCYLSVPGAYHPMSKANVPSVTGAVRTKHTTFSQTDVSLFLG